MLRICAALTSCREFYRRTVSQAVNYSDITSGKTERGCECICRCLCIHVCGCICVSGVLCRLRPNASSSLLEESVWFKMPLLSGGERKDRNVLNNNIFFSSLYWARGPSMQAQTTMYYHHISFSCKDPVVQGPLKSFCRSLRCCVFKNWWLHKNFKTFWTHIYLDQLFKEVCKTIKLYGLI